MESLSGFKLDSSPNRKQEYQRKVQFLVASVLFSVILFCTGIFLYLGYSYQILSVIVTQAYPESPALAITVAVVLSSAGILILGRLSNLWHTIHQFELAQREYEEDEWPDLPRAALLALVVYQIPLVIVIAKLSQPLSDGQDLWSASLAVIAGKQIIQTIALGIFYIIEAGLIAAFIASTLLLLNLSYPYWKGVLCALRRRISRVMVLLLNQDPQEELQEVQLAIDRVILCWSGPNIYT